MIDYLNLEDLLGLAQMLGEPAVRDLGLLEAAAARPQASAFGADAYPTLELKAAALLESLVRNHALVDGNKRIGWVATRLFYRLNGHQLIAPQNQAYDLVIGIAEGRLELTRVADQLRAWTTQGSVG